MEFTEKEMAIRKVLERRMSILDKNIIPCRRDPDKDYYEGKRDGLFQAYALLGESLESIMVELEEDGHLH